MTVSAPGKSAYQIAFEKSFTPKATSAGVSYNYESKLNEQNARTGSQFSVEKERAANGAQTILNILV